MPVHIYLQDTFCSRQTGRLLTGANVIEFFLSVVFNYRCNNILSCYRFNRTFYSFTQSTPSNTHRITQLVFGIFTYDYVFIYLFIHIYLHLYT